MPNGRDDTFRDTLYTAAVWQVIRVEVAADRANAWLHFLERLYKIGCGADFARRELFSLEDEQDLLERPCPQPQEGAGTTTWAKNTEITSTAEQMLARVEEAQKTPVQWEGDHTAIMIRSVLIAQEWRSNAPPGDPIARDIGDFELRSQVVVNMAIGSTKFHDEAKLVVAWINHRNEHSCVACGDPSRSAPHLRVLKATALLPH